MENSLANKKPWLVAEWSERNGSISPDDVPYGSKKLYWWHGSCGHEWQASAKARSSGENCPICSNARIVAGINDLLVPDGAARLHNGRYAAAAGTLDIIAEGEESIAA